MIFLKLHIKKALFVLFVILLGTLFLMAGLNYSGLCVREARWLSDDEFFKSAVKRTLRIYPYVRIRSEKQVEEDGKIITKMVTSKPKGFLPYQSLEEFMAVNNNCCTFEEPIEGFKPSLLDKVTGFFANFVTVRYQILYPGDSSKNSDRGRLTFAMTNCGRVYD